MPAQVIKITGARQHNLKNLSVEIPREKLVVITGLSGSGKSSLAFDTLYAEAQRRYLQSFSTYTRQFLERFDKPDADEISVIDHGRVIAHDTPDGLKRTLGGQRIRVKPTDRGRLADVNRILAEISGHQPQSTGRDQLTVAVDGEAALAATVGRLADEGISVTEMSLHLPTLDEVFLTLTGERLTDNGSDGSDTNAEVAA